MRVKCSKCNAKRAVRKDVLQKRMEKYNVGSIEELEKVYLCRACRRWNTTPTPPTQNHKKVSRVKEWKEETDKVITIEELDRRLRGR